MKSTPWLVLSVLIFLFSLGCFAFWLFLYFRFGGSLLEDVWLLVVALVMGSVSFGAYYNYRFICKANKACESDNEK